MRKGKMVAQGAHASLRAFFNAVSNDPENATAWLKGLSTKVCVGVPSESALLEIFKSAVDARLPCAIITDAGKTEFSGVPTKTALAIGPCSVEEVDKITGALTLL